MILQSQKSRFKRSRSDLSEKTCSNHQLKIAVLIDSGDVLKFKMMFRVLK